MAARANLRRRVDPVLDARRRVQAVNLTLGRHYTMCARCGHAHGDYRRYCDDGWAMAKAAARATAALRRLEDAEARKPVQGTLW